MTRYVIDASVAIKSTPPRSKTNEALMITGDRRYHEKTAHPGRIMLLEQLAA